MKHGYSSENESDLIDHFKVIDDKIEITYLDNSFEYIDFNDENINKLLEKELNQAKVRQNPFVIYSAYEKRNRSFFEVVSWSICLGLIELCGYIEHHSLALDSYLKWFVLVMLGGSLVKLKLNQEEVTELKKYGIYLDIYDKINNNCFGNSLYKGLKGPDTKNINNIDSFSLKYLKGLRANLTKLEDYWYSPIKSYVKKSNK